MSDYLIGVQARMEDARLLVEAGRYEGALLMLLAAISATSRKYYPDPCGAGEAFRSFLEARMHHLSGIEDALRAAGITLTVPQFLWKMLRNALEHEGQLCLANHPCRPGVLVTLAGDRERGIGLNRNLLNSLERVLDRCGANSWEATRDEMRLRHPEQQDEPTAENETIPGPAVALRERLERIEFFLSWFRSDARAVEALQAEKAEIENVLNSQLSGGK